MLADDTSELLIPRLFQPADSRLPAAPEADPGPGTPVRRAPPTESDDQPNGANTKAAAHGIRGRTQGRMLLSHALRRSQSESFVSRVHEMIVFTRSHTAHAHAGIYIFGT